MYKIFIIIPWLLRLDTFIIEAEPQTIKHCYRVLIGDDYHSEWIRVWAGNIESVYDICAKRHPDKLVEQIEYIK